eukprot:TRINITY_DN49110_c0_g1_i1.p1 TRINITY_DN49110_c0_g1~~TRINITY_DN49110_c0_g1_i1.p1  ORF type:complete len:639 (-),score=179.37 TRINITY_DN49110_c0_g1_i1:222-2138(-)
MSSSASCGSAQPGQIVAVKLRTLAGGLVQTTVSAEATLKDLKRNVAATFDVPADCVRIVQGGALLDDGVTVAKAALEPSADAGVVACLNAVVLITFDSIFTNLKSDAADARAAAVNALAKLGERSGEEGLRVACELATKAEEEQEVRDAALRAIPRLAAADRASAEVALLEAAFMQQHYKLASCMLGELSETSSCEAVVNRLLQALNLEGPHDRQRYLAIVALAKVQWPDGSTVEEALLECSDQGRSGEIGWSEIIREAASVALAERSVLVRENEVYRQAADRVQQRLKTHEAGPREVLLEVVVAVCRPSSQFATKILKAALQDLEPRIRVAALRFCLEAFKETDTTGVDLICRALEDREPQVKKAAVETSAKLPELHQETLLQALQKRLGHRASSVRLAAVEALTVQVARGSEEAAKAMASGLEDKDAGVRRAAVDALKRYSAKTDTQTMDILAPKLEHQDAGVRIAATRALTTVASLGNENALVALRARLQDANAEVRRKAAEALGQVGKRGDDVIVAVLVARLEDADMHVRAQAVEALGKVAIRGSERTIRAVTPFLAHQDPNIRCAAIEATLKVSEVGNTTAIRALRARQEDEDKHAREAAAYALEHLSSQLQKCAVICPDTALRLCAEDMPAC